MILLTGSQGVIGRRLLRMLRRAGHRVRTVDIKRGADFCGDLRDSRLCGEMMQGVTTVIHLAASSKNAKATYDNNVRSTAALLKSCREQNVKRFVLASSINVYGQGEFKADEEIFVPPYLPIDEDVPCRPSDSYGKSKQECEALLREACSRSTLKGMALRLGALWMPERTEAFIAGPKPKKLTPLNQIDPWHYLDLRDLFCVVERYLDHEDPAEYWCFYLVAPDTTLRETTREVFLADLPEWWALFAQDPEPHGGWFSTRAAEEALGWRARYSWRDVTGFKQKLGVLKGFWTGHRVGGS